MTLMTQKMFLQTELKELDIQISVLENKRMTLRHLLERELERELEHAQESVNLKNTKVLLNESNVPKRQFWHSKGYD